MTPLAKQLIESAKEVGALEREKELMATLSSMAHTSHNSPEVNFFLAAVYAKLVQEMKAKKQ